MSATDAIKQAVNKAEAFVAEPPRPLARELPPASTFPTAALGPLAAAAEAIHDLTQAPIAICGGSVLAAGALAAQALGDVVLLSGQTKPASVYMLSVAASGERKTTVDGWALRPVRAHEATLREAHDRDLFVYENNRAAWEESRKRTLSDNKRKGSAAIRSALDELGPPPAAPLTPMLTCPEPTIEGLHRLLERGFPSVGIFSAEGGQFIGGHAMSDDARLRSAAGLNALWDGEPLRRVRAGDGASELPGRRVSLHLMAQPDVAGTFIADPVLADTGLLGRMLMSAPDTTAGTRFWKEPNPGSQTTIEVYNGQLKTLLEKPLPLAAGTRNVLSPPALRMGAEGRKLLIAFYDNVERQMAPGGALEGIRPLGSKAAEHVTRIAGVLTLVAVPDAGEIPVEHVAGAIHLVDYYIAEALRLQAASGITLSIQLAQRTLAWLRETWTHPAVSLPDLYQRGPAAIREKATATKIAEILQDHGYLIEMTGGVVINGAKRKTAWKVVR
jgi:hypothetical protein